MFSIGHLRQVAVSAAYAELALLRAAPALLEALSQHWHCLSEPRGSCNTSSCCHVDATDLLHSSSSSSSGSRLLPVDAKCSPNPSMQPNSTHLQHRLYSSSSGATITDIAESSSSSSSSSVDGQDHHHQQQQQRQDAYRRGFGAKVSLPATDVLHEVLVGHPATIKFRAYHLGARIHIGQVLQHAQQQGCRTNSGKDYCIIWPPDNANTKAPHSPKILQEGASIHVSNVDGGRSDSSSSSIIPGSSSSSSSDGGSSRRRRLPNFTFIPSSSAQQFQSSYEYVTKMTALVKDMILLDRLLLQRKRAAAQLPAQAPPEAWRKRSMEAQQQIEPLLVVYRVGSVVCLGAQQQREPDLIDEYVPRSMRYKAGGDSAWTRAYRVQQPRAPAEEHTVKVVPGQGEPATKGTDQVMLRVLDVGAVRVITSVLAQSAALKFYETSVAEALDRLAKYRAMVRSFSKVQHSSLAARAVAAALFKFSWLGEQERTFFKVIAASALVISEARALLEMAEPAWDYAAYHSIWTITAEDHELEGRLKALEVKLRQVEKEAKHDVKDRAGRRYHRLEQSVVWLLVVSCMLAALEVGKKAISKNDAAHDSSSMIDSSSGLSSVAVQVVDAAAPVTAVATSWAVKQ